MTSGPIWKNLILFAIPILLGDLFQQFYNMADSIIVGRFVGKTAFAAIGSTVNVTNIAIGLFTGLGLGATAVIARWFGAEDEKRFRQSIYTAVIMAIALGAVLTVGGIVITPSLLRMMDTPTDVFREAEVYLKIYFGGMVGLVCYNILSSILRAAGDSKRPLYLLVFCCLSNIALDILFVYVFKWGIAGAGIATILAEFASAGVLFYILSQKKEICCIPWKTGKFSTKTLMEMVRIGIPVAIQKTIISFSNVFAISYINYFGTDVLAGWSAYSKIEPLSFAPIQSMSFATTTFVSQNFGQYNFERMKKGVRDSLIIAFIVAVLTAGFCIGLAKPLVSLFCNEAEVIRYGAMFIRINMPFLILCCLNQIFAGALRAVGYSRDPMIINIGTHVVIRQIFLYIISITVNDLRFISFAFPNSWILNSTATTVYYFVKMKKFYAEHEKRVQIS